jgi:hypothetical protein
MSDATPTPTPTRYVALVGAIAGERRVAQTAGFPLDPAKMLPLPDVVLVVADRGPGGGAMLFRYTAHGELAGDTWHVSLAEARAQAAYEYGDALVPWIEVPEEIGDAHAFAVRYAFEQLNSRGDW